MTGHPQGFSRRSRRDRSTGAMTCCPTRGNLPWERSGVGRTGRGASPAAQLPRCAPRYSNHVQPYCYRDRPVHAPVASATPGFSARPCLLPLPPSSVPRQDMGSRRRRPGGLWPRGTLVRTRVPTTTTERHVVPGRKSSSRWLIFEHYQRWELRPFEKDNKEKEAVASEGSWMCLPTPFPFTQHTPCTSGQSKLWKTKLQ